MKQVYKITLSLMLLMVVAVQAQQDYYWVGGGGNWSDINHWSKTSGNTGGVKHDVVPNINDNVIFDANSGFTSGNNKVTLDAINQYCRNMTWINAPANPILFSYFKTLNIGGSVVLQSGMTYRVHYVNWETSNTVTWRSNGVSIQGYEFNVKGSGNYTFLDNIIGNSMGFFNFEDTSRTTLQGATNSLGLNHSYLENSATLIAQNTTILGGGFISLLSSTSLDISGSTLEFDYWRVPQLSLTATNSHIKVRYGVFNGNAAHQYDKVTFNGDVEVYNNHKINTLILEAGAVATFTAGTTQTIKQALVANTPACSGGLIELKSSTAGTQATLAMDAGATSTLNGVLLKDIQATGSGIPLSATNSFDKGNNTGFTITNHPAPKTLYWIGGNGNWNTASNWTTDPNGASTGGCVPTPLDDVVFNEHSGFTSGNNKVTLDAINQYCRNMTWINAPANPILYGSDKTLNIGGSVVLQSGMTYRVHFVNWETSNTVTWRSNGVSIQFYKFNVKGSGNYTFLDNIIGNSVNDFYFYFKDTSRTTLQGATNSLGYFSYLENSATLIAQNTTILGREFYSNSSSTSLDISGSTLEFSEWSVPQLSLTATNSHIKVRDGFNGNAAHQYDKVTFNGNVNVGNVNHKINTLTLEAGIVATFTAGTTQTIKQALVTNTPACSGLIELKSSAAGTQATLAMDAGATSTLNGVSLKDIQATGSGIPLSATNSFDKGNNTGFTITNPAPKTLYWIGGNGNWNTASNWTTDPNGASTGGCIPTPLDDVVFNEHSGFTSGNNTVTLDAINQYCRNMTWINAPANPILDGYGSNKTLNIGGSVVLQSGMTYRARYVNWETSNTVTWRSNGVSIQGYEFYVKGSGNYTFLDNIIGNSMNYFYFKDTSRTTLQGATNSLGFYYSYLENSATLIAQNTTILGWVFNSDSSYTSLDISGSTLEFDYWKVPQLSLTATNSHIKVRDGFHGNAAHQYDKVTFNGNVNVGNVNHKINTLILEAGAVATFTAGTTQTINNNLYASGNNCFKNILKSSTVGTQANIKVLAGSTNYDFIRIKDINATGSHTQWHSAFHSEDQGNNTFMTFDPPASGDVKGLGDDMPNVTLPHTITTDGFFPTPQTTFLWNDGSTGSTLVVNSPGLYTCTATYGNGCVVTSTVRIGPMCYRYATVGTPIASDIGVSTLSRTSEAWLSSKPNGQLVLESSNKGLILPEMTSPETTITGTDLVSGMIVWDTDDKCIKLYNGSAWKCIEQGCDK